MGFLPNLMEWWLKQCFNLSLIFPPTLPSILNLRLFFLQEWKRLGDNLQQFAKSILPEGDMCFFLHRFRNEFNCITTVKVLCIEKKGNFDFFPLYFVLSQVYKSLCVWLAAFCAFVAWRGQHNLRESAVWNLTSLPVCYGAFKLLKRSLTGAVTIWRRVEWMGREGLDIHGGSTSSPQ